MKTNRPLSPHLTVYKPQITSILSIFHRISGAFLALTVCLGILSLKICDLSLSFYDVYYASFHIISSSRWILISLYNVALLAFFYHISNGIRYLLWDFGLFYNLQQVYRSGIIVVGCALILTIASRFL